jgi:hypothetical protein
MLQIVGREGKIVIPMSEALRAADNKLDAEAISLYEYEFQNPQIFQQTSIVVLFPSTLL